MEAAGFAPDEAITMWESSLTPFEQEEIEEFDRVYWVSPLAFKSGADPDSGIFDDEKGRYLGVTNDHVAYRFELQKTLGKGAFGDVFQALDHKTGDMVAVKIIRNERRFHRQAKVEIDVLTDLRSTERGTSVAIKLLEHLEFRNHVILVFELAGSDLYHQLKVGAFAGLEADLVQQMAREMTQCLELTHELQIVHADLKPENVLVLPEEVRAVTGRQIKVIDFGSACREHGKIHTYIQSRYYRSPEVVLGMGYGCPIDMWSLGCIVVELLTGRPLFPAKSEGELMLLIAEVLGLPSPHVLGKAQRGAEFFPSGLLVSRRDRKGRVRRPGSRTLASAINSDDTDLLDFVSRCLTWDPVDRITPTEALHHPYLLERVVTPEPTRRPSMLPLERSPLHRVLASSFESNADSGVEGDTDHDDTSTAMDCEVEGGIPIPSKQTYESRRARTLLF